VKDVTRLGKGGAINFCDGLKTMGKG
jgi:hypothetical protein